MHRPVKKRSRLKFEICVVSLGCALGPFPIWPCGAIQFLREHVFQGQTRAHCYVKRSDVPKELSAGQHRGHRVKRTRQTHTRDVRGKKRQNTRVDKPKSALKFRGACCAAIIRRELVNAVNSPLLDEELIFVNLGVGIALKGRSSTPCPISNTSAWLLRAGKNSTSKNASNNNHVLSPCSMQQRIKFE